MSSEHAHAQNLRRDLEQGNLGSSSPAEATAKKALQVKLDRIFEPLLSLIILTFLMFSVFAYYRGLTTTQYSGGLVFFVLWLFAAFGIYVFLNRFYGIPAEVNTNLSQNVPRLPAARQQPINIVQAVDTEPSGVPLGNDNKDHTQTDSKIPGGSRGNYTGTTAVKIQRMIEYEPDQFSGDQIWAEPQSPTSHHDDITQYPHDVAFYPVLEVPEADTVSQVAIMSQVGHDRAADSIYGHTVFHQQHLVDDDVHLTESQAQASLQSLLDRIEKDAERDGCIAAEYRHRRRLEALFKAPTHTDVTRTSLRKSFLAHVKKYATNHKIHQTGSLYARGIMLAHCGDSDSAKSFWGFLKRYEIKKERDLASTQRSQEALARYQREREEGECAKKEQFLQKVRQYAVDVGVKEAKRTFSNHPDAYGCWVDEIAPILDEVRSQEIEKKRQQQAQKQARLESICEVARACSIKSAREKFSDELRTLIPASKIPKFWEALYRQRLQMEATMYREDSRKKAAIYEKIGAEAVKETFFNDKIDKPTYRRSKKPGMRISFVLHCKETYARHKDLLSLLVGPKNAREKLLKLHGDEMRRHGQSWKTLAFLKKQMEECNSVFYVAYWHGDLIDQLCRFLGFDPAEFWNHVYDRQELRSREEAAEYGETARLRRRLACEAAEQESLRCRAAAETRQRRVREACAIGDAARERGPDLIKVLGSVAKTLLALEEFRENFRREEAGWTPVPEDTSPAAQQEEVAEDERLSQGLAVQAPLPGGLDEPTTTTPTPTPTPTTAPTPVYTPKPWDPDAGGFTQYWQRQAAQQPIFEPRPYARNSGSRFNLRHVRAEIWPQRQELTIHSFYGYMLRYRLVTRDMTARERTKQAEDGYRWPTLEHLEPRWAAWKPAAEFKLPVNERFHTEFRSMVWMSSIEFF